MIRLNLVDVKAGMILAQPVRNHQGVLLLEAGAKISKKSIRILKSWGVPAISIKGNLAETGSTTDDAEIRSTESIEKQLREKFSNVLDDPVMVEIFNAARNRFLKGSTER